MKLLKILSLFILIGVTLFASFPPNWELTTYKENNNTSYTLSYTPFKGTPLYYCLSQIDKGFAIRIMLPLRDSKVQNEIKAYYEKYLTKALANALKSSGNMSNPKMEPLIENFPSAFKSTSLYKNLAKSLQDKGYTIEKEIDFEKFMIFKKVKPYIFHADIWLHANPVSH